MDGYDEDLMFNQMLEVEAGGSDFDEPTPSSLIPTLSRLPEERDFDDFRHMLAADSINRQMANWKNNSVRKQQNQTEQHSELKKVSGKVLATYLDKNRFGKDKINIVIDNGGKELYLTSIKLASELKSLKEGQILDVEYFENGQFNNIVTAKIKKSDAPKTAKLDEQSLIVSVDDPEMALAALQFEWHRRMKVFWKSENRTAALKDMSIKQLENAIDAVEREIILRNEEDNLK